MQWFQRISHLNGLKSQGRRKFSNGHCDLIPLRIFFILITPSTKVPLIIHTEFQLNIPIHSGEKDDFNGLAIFSIGGHLRFSTWLTFTGLKPCRLIMLHVKFEIHKCSGCREKVIQMDLKARVDVNCERKDGRPNGQKTGRLCRTLLKQVYDLSKS